MADKTKPSKAEIVAALEEGLDKLLDSSEPWPEEGAVLIALEGPMGGHWQPLDFGLGALLESGMSAEEFRDSRKAAAAQEEE